MPFRSSLAVSDVLEACGYWREGAPPAGEGIDRLRGPPDPTVQVLDGIVGADAPPVPHGSLVQVSVLAAPSRTRWVPTAPPMPSSFPAMPPVMAASLPSVSVLAPVSPRVSSHEGKPLQHSAGSVNPSAVDTFESQRVSDTSSMRPVDTPTTYISVSDLFVLQRSAASCLERLSVIGY